MKTSIRWTKISRAAMMSMWGTAMIFALVDCSSNPVTGKKELSLMSENQEIAMGMQADPEIVAEFGLYEDAALQQFITEKGKAMAAISHRPNLDYQFKILDSPVVNAFALPGGYVYFTRGILAHFNNEAQFAGVLGHEIGHVTARHSARQYSRTILAQIGLVAGIIIKPELAQFAEAASQGIGLLLLKYSRDAESESDQLGVEYASKIDYDAREMAGFFATLDQLSGGEEGRLPVFMSTHPDPGDRQQRVGVLATDWQQRETGRSYKVGRDSYLRMIDGLVYGEDPRQGFVENSVFYHPTMKFEFPSPAQWKLVNSPQQVQMAPADGKALLFLTLSPARSLNEAADSSVSTYKLVVTGRKNVKVNGLDALELEGEVVQQGQNAQGQPVSQVIKTLSYFIQYEGSIYQFMGLALEADYAANRQFFMATMTGFRRLTDPAKLSRMPERVQVRTVNNSMTLQQALQQFNVPADRHQEMAILNGMALTSPLEAGSLIKTVK